jgi:flagellar basal body-associated protein FliL
MEKNDKINTTHSPKRGKNRKLIIVISVVAVLLIAGATYFTVTLLNLNTNKNQKEAAKPKLVAPAKVMTNLKAANDAAKTAHDMHTNTKAAFDEQPVKLVK